MSKNIVLDIENVSKQYRLGEVGTGTLQHDIKRWWANIRGKEDPYLKIGDANDRTLKGDSDYVWALKDINFQVEEGQAVGIIGRNGAGKSTLLKLLSRVTKPTTGSIKYKGRIASLLEVGTGFHPEMTGRENIYLNGAILGMTRKEISRKFDEIVDFAGVERYIDTPVKRYSSGMYVRLAFAVAAHLESEILIVDEVLAVGDAEFQKKCLGKMGDVSKGEGRTILFVSHNMASVNSLCDSAIIMDKGGVLYTGRTDAAVDLYREINSHNIEKFSFSNRDVSMLETYISDFNIISNNSITDKIEIGEFLKFKIKIHTNIQKNVTIRITIFNNDDLRIYSFDSADLSEIIKLNKGENDITCTPKQGLYIKYGVYKINVSVKQGSQIIDYIKEVSYLDIMESDFYGKGVFKPSEFPLILTQHEWKKD